MEMLVQLLIVLIFAFIVLLPALAARLVSRPEQGHRFDPRPSRPPIRRVFDMHAHPREEDVEPAISLEVLPRRPSSLEEMIPHLPISLEEMPSPSPLPRPHVEPSLRRRRFSVRRSFDVRQGIMYGAVLGPPRADEPHRTF